MNTSWGDQIHTIRLNWHSGLTVSEHNNSKDFPINWVKNCVRALILQLAS